ncbi:hypothetical protein POMI540_3709 [Schizosaccharomyces pombe]
MEAVIANILQQLGFDSMTKAAEASFVEAVDKYLRNSFRELALHTQLSKHTIPTTKDVALWLNLLNIPMSSLQTELEKNSKPLPPAINDELDRLANESQDIPSKFKSSLDSKMVSQLLGSLAVSQNRPAYVVNHLPPFPASHTYMATPVYPVRPTSPKQIRELATQESRLAEHALRKILNVNQPRSADSPRHASFEKACSELNLDVSSFHLVNWESQKWSSQR